MPNWDCFVALLPDRKTNHLLQHSPCFLLTHHQRRLRLYFSFATSLKKLFSESLTYQKGLIIGLPMPIWIFSTCNIPSHLCSTLNLVTSIWLFPTTSNSRAFSFIATSFGFVSLLLKIKSFLANQIFHHKNVGMACQIFLHSWLVEGILGYLAC